MHDRMVLNGGIITHKCQHDSKREFAGIVDVLSNLCREDIPIRFRNPKRLIAQFLPPCIMIVTLHARDYVKNGAIVVGERYEIVEMMSPTYDPSELTVISEHEMIDTLLYSFV